MKKISEETYLKMKKIVKDYENNNLSIKKEEPYLTKITVRHKYYYNPNYGDDRICICGHPYYRHFDSYEDMFPIGCKYCNCIEFKEDVPKKYNL